MTAYDWYVFSLCLVVFVLLTAFFAVLITSIVRLTLRLIRCGAEDETLQREAEEAKRNGGGPGAVGRAVSVAADVLLLLLLGAAVFFNLCGRIGLTGLPTPRAVKSGSMAEKAPGNTYLFENSLDDQLQTFDLILTYPLPEEAALKLYDIVVYEAEGAQVIHRIVGIEEPGGASSGRRFTTQGDAVAWPDGEAVEYAQLRGIYRGERVPFLGSLVLFLQSPAGWLCILLMAFAAVASPVVERKLTAEKRLRLKQMAEERERGGAGVEK